MDWASGGAGWQEHLHLPFTGVDLDGKAYPIADDAAWKQVVANIAALLPRVEAELVPELEAAFGATPRWWVVPPHQS